MAVAPSADPTDDPSVQRLYVADASGSLVEVAIQAEVVVAAAINTTATLLRTYNTFQFNPPSPDPSGVVWLPYRNQLLISDGEVDEMGIFANVNLWYATPPSGANAPAGNTVSFNNEPTGVGFDPGTGPTTRRIFISNDNGAGKIDIVSLGANGEYDLGDTRACFSTGGLGTVDTEDVAFHQGNGHLYIADGVGREVWDVDPGPNGVFQGGGDDIISHFDVGVYGALDPEGVAYSPASGRVLVVDSKSKSVYELETNGTLVNKISISATGGTRIAGITLAPASNGSGATSMYIVDRKVDNNADPNENDGLMYETTAPLVAGGNQPPLANAGVDQQITSSLPATATLDGTASTDDNGITDYAWTKVSGPAATINNPGSASTTVSLSAAGTYTFRLTVTDGDGLTDTDDVVVTVIGPGGPFNWDGAVAVGADDAEEKPTGAMVLGNADLDLVFDSTTNLTTALRFTGVTIPAGATITSAYIQFRSDEIQSGTTNLLIEGHKVANAPAFTTAKFNITGRARTLADVPWAPAAWTAVGLSGTAQRTPDLASIMNELTAPGNGWASGNAMVFIFTGSGKRTADPIEGGFAPQLHVVYTTGGPPPNQPPVANAGPDQQINSSVPATATLDGTASTDDNGITDYAWTKVSGPAATIDNPGSASTTVSLSALGSYTFRLTVTDGGALTDTDDVVINVIDSGGATTWEGAVAVGSDDAEQLGDGQMRLANAELELVVKVADTQTVGVRFPNVAIPQGATIVSAYVQFRAVSVSTGSANLVIKAQASDNAPTFTTGLFHISNRPTGTQSVQWDPLTWDLANEVGPDQQTADLTTVIQEVISRPGWASGNGVALIFTGSGTRVADSIEGGFAPRLVIEYTP